MLQPGSIEALVVATLLLATLLHLLHNRLRQEEFLRWWAWAWTVYGVSATARWFLSRAAWLEPVWLVFGCLTIPLLARGAWAAAGRSWPRWLPWNLTLAAAGAFGIATFVIGESIGSQFRPFVLLTPRLTLTTLAYLGGAAAFYYRWRRDGSSAAAVTAISSAAQALAVAMSAANPVAILFDPSTPAQNPWWVVVTGLSSQCGIGVGVVMILLDEHRKAEQELRQSREHYRGIVETAAEGIWLVDPKGRITFANQRMAELMRLPQEQFTGKNPFELGLVPEESRSLLREMHRRRLQGLKDQYPFRYRRADGTPIWLLVSAAPILNAAGEFTGSVSMFTDISELKDAEQALMRSEARYRALFENARDIIYTRDLDGRFTSINRAGEEVTGYSREEILGLNVMDLVTEPFREPLRKRLDKRTTEDGRNRTDIRTKDGRIVTLEVAHRTIYEDQRPVGVEAIARDVTEQLRLEEELRQAQKMEALGRLAGGVAHDFNNLLAIILGYADLLRQQHQNDADEPKLEQIRKAARRGADLTNQLLAFSRKQVLSPQRVDLNAVIMDLRLLLAPILGENIELDAELDPALGAVMADRGQLEQVVLNLALNARDAMPAGGALTLTTRNTNSDAVRDSLHLVTPPGDYVELVVRDTGTGMDAATRARVFDPFFTTKERGRGTGLGLATVYGIVRQSGGFIEVASEPNSGAAFHILLPRVEGPVAARPAEPEARATPGAGETILVAEDEDALRSMVAAFLQERGYHVLEAADAFQAIEAAAAHGGPIHLLLTDVVMPGMNGRQLADRLVSHHPELKVVYVSGYTDQALQPHEPAHNGFVFLQKPFSVDQLGVKIREALEA
jgi:PAS domain S-box-containing protein